MRSLLFCLAIAVLALACGDSKTPNGYAFTRIKAGSGEKVKPGDYAYLHAYIFKDDSLMQSTRQMGRTLPVRVPDLSKLTEEEKKNNPPNPVTDGASVMKVGDSIVVEIPKDDKMMQAPALQGAKKVTYSLVLLEIKTEEQYQAAIQDERKAQEAKMAATTARSAEISKMVEDIAKQYKSGALKGKLQTTASGLKYMITQAGDGPTSAQGEKVQVQYYGTLTNGTRFDDSFSKGTPFVFALGTGQVIKGWDEGFALLKQGDHAFLFVPPDLGYGSQANGPIPANSELIFYVELEKQEK